jgi:hypothetical protein
MTNNKQVMTSILVKIKEKFNVRVTATIAKCGKEISIDVIVYDIPESFKTVIAAWVNSQGFELPTYVDSSITASYLERVNTQCAKNGARQVTGRNTSNGKEEMKYLKLDIKEALEQIWSEDQKQSKVVIVPTYKGKQELQYA